ncbi:hypothetical protein K3495_g16233, partial [Podosphaera aphanis]
SERVVSTTQIFPSAIPTGDYCWVVVNGITFLHVYKAPNDSLAIQPLTSWVPSSNSVAVGDFNEVHSAWQANITRAYGQGDEIERWAECHNLSCLIVNEPTHRAGNTLDLAWTNISGSLAWVDRSECVTSDHLPICGQIPNTTAFMDSEPAKIRVPRANYSRYAHAIAHWVHPPPILDTTEKVEIYAQELCFQLSNAIKATGTRIGKASGKSAPWWTSRCKAAHIEYQAATIPSQRDTCARVLRRTISAAKKEYQTCRVEAMTTPVDIYKLMRSSKPKQAETPPPLNHNGILVTNPAERATILRDALL